MSTSFSIKITPAPDFDTPAVQSRLELFSLEYALTGPFVAVFRDPTIRSDSVDTVAAQGDLVEISDDEFVTKCFTGWVRKVDPETVGKSGVTYTAYDMRYRLEHEIKAKRNGGYQWAYNKEGQPDATAPGYGWQNFWTIGEAFHDLLEHALGIPGGGTAIPSHHTTATDVTNTYLTSDHIADYTAEDITAMDRDVICFDIQGQYLGQLFSMLCAEQTDLSWYIDPDSGNLVIVDITESAAVDINAGELGHQADESGKSYNLQDIKLTFSLEGVYSKVTIQGRNRLLVTRPEDIIYPNGITNDPENEYWTVSDADSIMEKGWDADLEATWTLEAYNAGDYDDTDDYKWVWRRFIVGVEHHWPWRCGVLDSEKGIYSGMIFYENDDGDKLLAGSGIDGAYAAYADKGMICYIDPLSEAWRDKNRYVWCCYEAPFVVSVGFSGDAYDDYGHEAEWIIVDENFEHETSRWPYNSSTYETNEIHDDTDRMTAIATKLHAMMSTEIVAAEITISPIDMDAYTLHKKINLQNLDKWDTIGLQIFSIKIEPTTERMMLSCANKIEGVTETGEHLYQYIMAIHKRNMDARTMRSQAQYLKSMETESEAW